MISFREYHKLLVENETDEALKRRYTNATKEQLEKDIELLKNAIKRCEESIKSLSASNAGEEIAAKQQLSDEKIKYERKLNNTTKKLKELSNGEAGGEETGETGETRETREARGEETGEETTWRNIEDYYNLFDVNGKNHLFIRGNHLNFSFGSGRLEDSNKQLINGLNFDNLSTSYIAKNLHSIEPNAVNAACLIFMVIVAIASHKLQTVKNFSINNEPYTIKKSNNQFAIIDGNHKQTGFVGAVNACKNSYISNKKINLNPNFIRELDLNPKYNKLDYKSIKLLIDLLDEKIKNNEIKEIFIYKDNIKNLEDKTYTKDENGKWKDENGNVVKDEEILNKLNGNKPKEEITKNIEGILYTKGENEEWKDENGNVVKDEEVLNKLNQNEEENKNPPEDDYRSKIDADLQAERDDPYSVSSLNVESDKIAISKAIEGTFGTHEGSIYDKAVQKLLDARDKIRSRYDRDQEHFKNIKDKEKELEESVIMNELLSNPLLKEEKNILLERINLRSTHSDRSYARALGKDNFKGEEGEKAKQNPNAVEISGKGSLEEYRNKMQQKAQDIVNKYHLDQDYVDRYKKSVAISKIKGVANNYFFGLNKKVNDIIKRNDYGEIGGFIRDMKMSRANRIENKNEVYDSSAKGQSRQAEEKIIKDGLEKLNSSNKDEAVKMLLSVCAISQHPVTPIRSFNLSARILDHKSKTLNEKYNFDKFEGDTIAKKIMNFARDNISTGMNDSYIQHLGTLIRKGNYENLYDPKLGKMAENIIMKDNGLGDNAIDTSYLNGVFGSMSSTTASTGKPNNTNAQTADNTNGVDSEMEIPRNNQFTGNNNAQERQVASGENMSVVTEEFIISEEGEPISRSGTEMAILKALSMNPQEAAEGKQWIIDNVYKGNPLAGKIVDKFVQENSKKIPKAAKELQRRKQINQQTVSPNVNQQAITKGTPNQVATAMQSTGVAQQANVQQQAAQPNPNAQSQINKAPVTTQPSAQPNTGTQQQSQATVTTAATDGFPNRLYKKIIRRKIGF